MAQTCKQANEEIDPAVDTLCERASSPWDKLLKRNFPQIEAPINAKLKSASSIYQAVSKAHRDNVNEQVAEFKKEAEHHRVAADMLSSFLGSAGSFPALSAERSADEYDNRAAILLRTLKKDGEDI
ncbi:MAG: hypothetical protein EOO38_14415 [Cytophagaceae bacterium]|nr:MAG: hypothetical protein EOO38_14415 [Cytophagaceae bacterium]